MATPVHSAITPVAGAALLPSGIAQFNVTSVPALAGVVVGVRFPGMHITEVAWDGSAFTTYYARSVRTAIADGFTFQIHREPAWPDAPTLTLLAINTSGEVLADETSYALSIPATAPGSSSTVVSAAPVYPDGPGPGAGADAAHLSYDDLLGLADRVLPDGYLRPMREGEGPGYELIRAYARLFTRTSDAVRHAEEDALASFARGGAFAEGYVEFYRDSYAPGVVTVKAGTVVSNGRVPFVVLEDATFGASELGPKTVRVRALAWGYQGNVSGEVLRTTGELLEGAVYKIERLLEDPPMRDLGMRVRNPLPISGGRDRALDALGSERNVIRRSGESDIAYRQRVRSLPDNITPSAIRRQVAAALDRWRGGGSFELIECWRLPFPMIWGGPGVPGGSYTVFGFSWGDPRARTRMFHRWSSSDLLPGGFVVVLPRLPHGRLMGFAWSDPTASIPARTHAPTGGRRARMYWSIPASTPAIRTGAALLAYWSAIDRERAAAYAAVDDLLQEIKAAGITAMIAIRET